MPEQQIDTETRQSGPSLDPASRILVTGGSGFIGTNVVDYYLRAQFEVFNLDIKTPQIAAHRSVFTQLDVQDSDAFRQFVKKVRPTHILHLAARTDLLGRSVRDYAINTFGVLNAIRAAATPSVQRVILASSRLVNEIGYSPKGARDYNPTTFYGQSKVQGELLAFTEKWTPGVAWCIVRPTSIWGPWFGVPYRHFFDHVLSGRYIHPAGKAIRKSFGYVENLVFELDRLAGAPATSIHEQTFYLADYEPIDVRSFARQIAQASGRKAPLECPVTLLRCVATAGDALKALRWANVPLTSFRLDNLLTEMIYNLEDTSNVVGSLPFSNAKGIERTLAWMSNSC